MLKTVSSKDNYACAAVGVLEADYRRIAGLLDEYESSVEPRARANLVARVCTELDVHTRIEQEIFYPAARKTNETIRAYIDDSMAEHSAIRRLTVELLDMTPADEFYQPKLDVLVEFVRHHARDQADTVLARLTESGLDLPGVCEQMLHARQQMQAGAMPLPRSRPRSPAPAAQRRSNG